MNIKTMKAIDRYVGIPVCLMLDIVHIICAVFHRSTRRPIRRILLMKYFGIGSIILASPVLRAIKSHYPNAEIGFLTFETNRKMVECLDLVDTVYTLRTDSLVNFSRDLFYTIRQIRRERYDVTIDMEFFAKFSTIVTYLSGSRIRIGYFLRQMWRGNLLTEQVYYNHYKPITEVFAALTAPLGITVSDYVLEPPKISDTCMRNAEKLLEHEEVGSSDFIIGFNINVSDLSHERRWPQEEFLELARGLLAELDAKIVFIGSSAEAANVAGAIAQLPSDGRVINLAGKTSLEELLAIMKHSQLLITNDSGPLHMATSLKLSTVSFFGPKTPMLYGPNGGDALVFYEGLYCSPCLNVFNVKTAPCNGQNVCMRGIKSEMVLQKMRAHFNDIWEQNRQAISKEA